MHGLISCLTGCSFSLTLLLFSHSWHARPLLLIFSHSFSIRTPHYANRATVSMIISINFVPITVERIVDARFIFLRYLDIRLFSAYCSFVLRPRHVLLFDRVLIHAWRRIWIWSYWRIRIVFKVFIIWVEGDIAFRGWIEWTR